MNHPAIALPTALAVTLAACASPSEVDRWHASAGAHRAELTQAPASPPIQRAPVSVDAQGNTHYTPYANQAGSALVSHPPLNTVPDFSFAGYGGGGVPLPDTNTLALALPATRVLVVPADPTVADHTSLIQGAIDALEGQTPALGVRGIVQLEAGTYTVSNTLRINASGVILRGAGQGLDGTVIHSTRDTSDKNAGVTHATIHVKGPAVTDGPVIAWVASPFVPVGAHTFDITLDPHTAPLAPGETIGLRRTPNTDWESDLFPRASLPYWGVTAGFFGDRWHERTVISARPSAVDPSRWTIAVDLPLVDAIYAEYGGAEVFRITHDPRITQVGVEDLRLLSAAQTSGDESQDWDAVRVGNVKHGWVRRVSVDGYARAAVRLRGDTRFTTIEEVAYLNPASSIDGGRRYAFNVTQNAAANVFQRCYAEQARHAFIASKFNPGPNVWLDSVARGSIEDDGPHARWVTGALFDNVSTNELHVENRQTASVNHGWAGAQTMFWNCKARVRIRCDAPAGAMNWAIGSEGRVAEGGWVPAAPFGWITSPDARHPIRSLYLRQLRDRRGVAGVEAVTVQPQRHRRIWQALKAWRGQGRLADWL